MRGGSSLYGVRNKAPITRGKTLDMFKNACEWPRENRRHVAGGSVKRCYGGRAGAGIIRGISCRVSRDMAKARRSCLPSVAAILTSCIASACPWREKA